MPKCAAFIDELREVFGVDEMNQVIRTGLRADCKPWQRVYFCEAGEVLGSELRPELGKVVSAAQMVLVKPVVATKGVV